MKVVFLDTVGLLAQWDASDQWHALATIALKQLMESRARTVTTTFIMLECGNAAARRPYRSLVAQTCSALQKSGRLISPTDSDWESAWSVYSAGNPLSAGIVDEISFAIMRRLGITDAFTNDRHFKTAGFNTLF